ncbi:Gamma-cystathionase [Aphelenchoides bicaudatus]|nr:Gamma-cystathionase [Aphelenchoides bicaudatus]
MLFTSGKTHPDGNMHRQVVPPITLSTTYKQLIPGQSTGYDYGRATNPNRDVLQENLAAMEKARRVYASGMAAVTAIASLLKSGDHMIINENTYSGTLKIFQHFAVEQHGLSSSLVDFRDEKALKSTLKPETKLVWFETPTNPLMQVVDIAEVVKIVKTYNPNIIIVTDNTFMTPYFQNPLTLGADIVMHSLTKYINGHSDVIMGAAMTNNEKLDERLHFVQRAVGAVPSPFDCYLANRGAKTLHVRMRAHAENGLAVARYLEQHPKVEKVMYPALESHPQHEIHKKQTTGMSGILSFYIKGGLDESHRFLSKLKFFNLAASLGGVESMSHLPSRMSHESVPLEEKEKLGITDNLIRISVGIEDKEDLLADLEQALKSSGSVCSRSK